MQNRIKYLDVAKFIGIFCIYLGHFGPHAGNAYGFVFSFHVALFFFLSGCSENLKANTPWYKYILKNVKGILLPCYIFALFSLTIHCIYENSHADIATSLIQVLKGCIRNQFLANSLWFFTCLFIVKIVFHFIVKIFKFKIPILIVSLFFYCVAEYLITPRPIAQPHMLYNVDSACYFIIFYAFGYCCFQPLHTLLTGDHLPNKIIRIIIGLVSFLYSASLFFGKNLLDLSNNKILSVVTPLLTPLIIILFVLILSKLLENVTLFNTIGQNTLFLCGTEHIVKLLVVICLETVGLTLSLTNPLATYMYTFALLIVCNMTLVPTCQAIFRKIRLIK